MTVLGGAEDTLAAVAATEGKTKNTLCLPQSKIARKDYQQHNSLGMEVAIQWDECRADDSSTQADVIQVYLRMSMRQIENIDNKPSLKIYST